MNQTLQHIALLGILERSGTNFLYNTLIQHPEITEMAPVGEDFLLKESDFLLSYCKRTAKNWHSMWGGGMDAEAQLSELKRGIGKGLLSYLSPTEIPTDYICSKTPSTLGIENFSQFFPDSKVILLVREPVNTIASGIKSFGWTWRGATRDWQASAKRILDFHHRKDTDSLIVRYEELIHQPMETLTGIFRFAGISETGITKEMITNQPVVGSSTYGKNTDDINWQGVQAGADFNPTAIPASVPKWAIQQVSQATNTLRRELGYSESISVPSLEIRDRFRAFLAGIKEYTIDSRRAFRARKSPSSAT